MDVEEGGVLELPVPEPPEDDVEGLAVVEDLSVDDFVSVLASDFESDLFSDLVSALVSVDPPSFVFLPSLNLSE
ncbi:MAG: hypothetical protein AB7P32_16865 [Nitrospirales bacterium]